MPLCGSDGCICASHKVAACHRYPHMAECPLYTVAGRLPNRKKVEYHGVKAHRILSLTGEWKFMYFLTPQTGGAKSSFSTTFSTGLILIPPHFLTSFFFFRKWVSSISMGLPGPDQLIWDYLGLTN